MNTKCYICPDEKSAMGKRKRKKLSSDLVMQYILYQVLKIYIFVKRPSPFNSNALNINHRLRYKTPVFSLSKCEIITTSRLTICFVVVSRCKVLSYQLNSHRTKKSLYLKMNKKVKNLKVNKNVT